MHCFSDEFGDVVVDVNYFSTSHDNPEDRLFICWSKHLTSAFFLWKVLAKTIYLFTFWISMTKLTLESLKVKLTWTKTLLVSVLKLCNMKTIDNKLTWMDPVSGKRQCKNCNLSKSSVKSLWKSTRPCHPL